ncbi:MAG: SLBB domain-containing protein [Thermoleophilia bacterium]|nr:SLBB domain-containing protein [Thermoleophilia bacterium]
MDGTCKGLERARALGALETVAELVRSGLRDRDYENLSTGSRMEAYGQLTGDGKRIVCDCVDVEPGLEVARYLLAHHAESMVEGALIAALATSTPDLVFHVAEDDGTGADTVALALQKVRSSGGPAGAAATAAGTGAAASSPAGTPRTAIVRAPFRPDFKGYEDVPTLVVGAETLLNVARVLADGADEFRHRGTPASPGTKFFQVSGEVAAPGVVELPLGVTLLSVVDEVCGGMSGGAQLQAVIVGGGRGALFREDELGLILDFDNLKQSGGVIGSGAIAVLDDGECVIDQTMRAMARSCYETCARCSLGREGSYQLREILGDTTRGKSRPTDLDMLREIGEAMRIGCACAAGRTAPNLVLSGMDKFAEEYESHMKRRRCKALVCAQYVTFHILPRLCDGCGACAEECPEDAIEGGRNKIHVIDQDSCEKCGRCYEVCAGLRKAVVKAGPVKPRTPKRPIPVGSWQS